MKTVRHVFAATVLAATALGASILGCWGSGAAAPPVLPAGTPVRIVITSGGLLLTGDGQERQLTAQALDAEQRALHATGSAQITARSGAVASDPMLVTVAKPVAGAVLVNDAQVAGKPEMLERDTKAVVGARNRLTLTRLAAPREPKPSNHPVRSL